MKAGSRLSKCFLSSSNKHEWRDFDEEPAHGKGEKWMRRHGWRQCVNCRAWIDWETYKVAKKARQHA